MTLYFFPREAASRFSSVRYAACVWHVWVSLAAQKDFRMQKLGSRGRDRNDFHSNSSDSLILERGSRITGSMLWGVCGPTTGSL